MTHGSQQSTAHIGAGQPKDLLAIRMVEMLTGKVRTHKAEVRECARPLVHRKAERGSWASAISADYYLKLSSKLDQRADRGEWS